MSFTVKPHGKFIPFFIPIFGVHNVCNALFAIAVADKLGFSHEEISRDLKEYIRPEMRMVTRKLNGEICEK